MFLHPENVIGYHVSKVVERSNESPLDPNRNAWLNYDCVIEALIAYGFVCGVDICGFRDTNGVSSDFHVLLNKLITIEVSKVSAIRVDVPPLESVTIFKVLRSLKDSEVEADDEILYPFLNFADRYLSARNVLKVDFNTKSVTLCAKRILGDLRSGLDVHSDSDMMNLTKAFRDIWITEMLKQIYYTVQDMESSHAVKAVSVRLAKYEGSENLIELIKFFYAAFDTIHQPVLVTTSALELLMDRSLLFDSETVTKTEWLTRALLD